MVRLVSLCAAVVVAGSGVFAGKGRKKRSAAGKVLGGLTQALGMSAAVAGATSGVSPDDVHPLYRETQADLGLLMSKPCDLAASNMGASRCAMEERFRNWAWDNKKNYVVPTTMEGEDGAEFEIVAKAGQESEYEQRFAIFAENVAAAVKYNEESEGLAVYGITKFMDLAEQEFLKQRTGLIYDETARASHEALPQAEVGKTSDFLADESGSKDWSADGFTTAIKDQGQCGSCWAFSTIEQIESMAIKQGIKDDDGSNFVLSPQELVSCDHNGDMGCGGGLPTQALEWAKKKALERESDYPYKSGGFGKNYKCHKDVKTKGVMEVVDYSAISSRASEESKLHDYLLTEGPASVAVSANHKWQIYKGGIMVPKDCEGRLDHAVQAVGINMDASVPYVKVRNSWAETWGEDGYIRLKAGVNTCNVAMAAVTTSVKKKDSTAMIV